MGSSAERVVAVIMVGGPTKGTRFRPLSLNVPKPLFPLAGQPMVHHPISACRRIPNLAQIYLIGFYEEREFALYVSSISNELRIPVRYLREDKPHGSAGGLYTFRDYIMEDSPSHIFLLNCDVCCSFPLPDMLEAHKRYGGMGTVLVSKVSAESANQFGELVADPATNELLHYIEKPETFVSDLINCGVYIFTPDIFTAIQDSFTKRKDMANLRRMTSFEALQSATKTLPADFVRLDQDILSPLAGKKQLYTYETLDFWEQIKTPGMSLKCSALYLSQYRHTAPHLLAGDGTKTGTITGDVYIHPSAKVHPTAKIGPNVSISANARIGAGVRLINCIVLDDVEIKENAVVIHSILGWKSTVGKWSRVQGEGDHNAKLGITILGEAVAVEDEVVVINSIVLPNKTLNDTNDPVHLIHQDSSVSEHCSTNSEPQPMLHPSPISRHAPPTTKRSRASNFNIVEDKLLVLAWLSIPMDGVQGNDKKHKQYWHRVWDFFHKYKTFESDRSQNSLMHRWSTIQIATNKFCECYTQIDAKQQSGVNEQDKIGQAKSMYRSMHKASFHYEHCWNELRHQPKWMETYQKKKLTKKVGTTSSHATSSPPTPDTINLGEDGGFEDKARPPSRKSEKEQLSKRKGKGCADEEGSSVAITELLKEIRKEKKQMNVRKMELYERTHQQERERLAHEQEKLRLKQQTEDERIMLIDTSGMPPMQKEYYHRRQTEILQRGFPKP